VHFQWEKQKSSAHFAARGIDKDTIRPYF